SSKIDIKLEKVNLEFDIFPDDNLLAFRLLLLVRDIEILDNIKTSAWNKFLSHMRPDNNTSPRESKSNMIRLELNSVRPTPTDVSEELRIKARFLPLRFYIDQDALQFLIRFLSFQDSTIEKPPQVEDDTYFQSFEIHPIKMKVDYKPKHIDYTNLKEGNLVELMNFFHFEAAEMTLSNVKLTGVKGCQRLFEELGAAWLPHIKSTQVPNVVSGVAPIRSLVNLGSGVADLILLPIEQYKKDGRIIRGLQKGTESFARATTMEAIRFGTKLAVGTQILLEQADEILSFESQTGTNTRSSTNPTISTIDEEFDSEEDNIKELISKYADQPADLNEGIEAAYKSLRANIGTAAHTIFAVPMEVYEKTGTQGTVKAVIRAVPVAVLKPMIGASEAVSKTLLGLRNTIDPNKKLQMEDKYKKR
ncbi:6789_t:CDS:2, partial [Funneliformis mosseae]